MSDSWLDIQRDKVEEWKMKRYFGRQDYCNRDCFEHNENCPYYDAEQEEWDFEQCFEDGGEVDLRE